MQSLPIDSVKNDIIETLKSHSTLILQAPPGSGKTTRVPQFLMQAFEGKSLVLEPRRLAARLSAERIAFELGQSCGMDVGFQIRFERMTSPHTRTVFMTEGLFLRTLLANPTLKDINFVVLDEFHERNIHSDIAFALTRALQKHIRPDLKLIIMSATLDADRLGEAISDAKVIKTDVPTHPVHIEFEQVSDSRALEVKVAAAVDTLITDVRCPGNILVFLPGVSDIRRAAQMVLQSKHIEKFQLFELRADTPAAEQKHIFDDGPKRKVILATNVAETSITLPGITGVVDSGLAKLAGHAHWSGLPTLDIKPISQSSAIQRSGRAGRTAPGIARRLYTRADFQNRHYQEKPEIQRSDLAQVILEVQVALQRLSLPIHPKFIELDWMDPPPLESVAAAHSLLFQLGAMDENNEPTTLASQMSRWPLHPRLARMLEEGIHTQRLREICLLVSILNEGFLLKRDVTSATALTDCDLHFQAGQFAATLKKPSTLKKSEAKLIDDVQLRKIERTDAYLRQIANIRTNEVNLTASTHECSPFAREILAGFPDRVVTFRKPKTTTKFNQEVVFAKGGMGLLSPASTVQESQFGVALHGEQVRRQGATHFTTEVIAASGLNSEILKEFFSSRIIKESVVVWDEQAEKVKSLERTVLDALVLEEKPATAPQSAFEQELFNQLRARWPRPFHDVTAISYFQTRLKILKNKFPEATNIDLLGEDFELFLTHLCEGKKSFSELTATSLNHHIEDFLPYDLKELINRELPQKIKLNSGRVVEVHYIEGQPPWLSSRMQDFFGTMQTPRVLGGALPVTIHLLAPNGQAVQVTTHLESFWQNTYPEVKKELARRYPRHYWPDDPSNAEPLTRRPRPNQTQASTSRSK